MTSTFSSLETVRRALATSQSAIQTTGHNVANADTDGYSRQRVNLQATTPYPSVGMNSPMIPGQIGTGVEAGSVDRIRDEFVDKQVRQQATTTGYWQAKSDALSQMENIMNEPTDEGLSASIDEFWQSLQDLADNPTNSGARSVVRQDAQTLNDTFHYLSSSLQGVQDNLKDQIGVNVKQINSLASQINELNKQISKVEPSGYVANDLYDQRDKLVDQLSQLANIQVSKTSSGGNASASADGIYTVRIVGEDNQTYTLVDGKNFKTNAFDVAIDDTNNTATVTVGGQEVKGVSGKIQGLIESVTEDYPNMMGALDQMAYNLANAFNEQHAKGYTLSSDDNPSQQGGDFFSLIGPDGQPLTSAAGAASAIDLSQAIKDSVNNIAAAGSANGDGTGGSLGDGDNTNANDLSDVLSKNQLGFSTPTTLQDYLQSTIGQMGVNASKANLMTQNSQTLQDNAAQQRQSISGVSLDEEMTNLIQYQHSYNAAAKMISVIDQMLDTIVNSLGR
ncbi:flagellar hook-associated protein 1 FlgK [Pullulanibacillus pueri]|uniref:Flagellar hook-associated protein 1 n=1 Tax=Pullulanibacillus pueri TaxID=1437324 RepID=A0A8J3EKV5_9BACL|nr:flagellar hook-associated protein FlgK [Pullulanibacillus pueri]MBM7684124.1 flagellar hook-associated protein 1 FlgK [Pullulanibacillus pueri]GGH76704.1 flagellar hook-associated protein 1 [Pullulanibacillus pueri]